MAFVSSSFVAKLIASDFSGGDNYGYSVSLSSDGNTAVIGAYLENSSSSIDNGAVYIYARSGLVWTEQAKLLASDFSSSDIFGYSVSISEDGNTVAVGAPVSDLGGASSTIGAAYVFTRSGVTWTQQQTLVASDAAANDQFGISVALSADSSTLVVGARYEDTGANSQNGAAYVFIYESGVWLDQAKLLASDAASNEIFGESVSVSGDGNTALIGAMHENTSPNFENGAVYVFTRSAGVWTQQQKLLASDRANQDYFGTSIYISSDGTTALIGARGESTSPASVNGAAYVFTREIESTTWTQQQKLLASDSETIAEFGTSVSLSADGNTAIIGAPNETTSPNSGQGAAYVFTRSGTTWTQQQKILASDAASFDQFGYSVAVSEDGLTFFIGAPNEDTSPSNGNGAAYIYRREEVPSAPLITGASHGDTEVTLTFNAPTSYPEWVANYEYSLDDGLTFTAFSPADVTSPVTITGLTNNVAYVVKLRAVNSSGDAGDASTGILVKSGVPTTPIITSVDRGGDYLDVNFIAPTSTGGNAISNYAYSYTSATVVISSLAPPTVSGNIATITTSTAHGMVAGVSVTTYNLTADVGFVEHTVLSVPSSTTYTVAYVASNGTLTLGASPTSTSQVWAAFSPTDTTTPVRVTGLESQVEYTVYIRAINSVGSGLSSNGVAGTPSNVPSPPTITAITSGNGTLTVAFTPPTYDGTNTISNYQYSLDGNITWTFVYPVDSSSSSLDVPSASTDPIVISGLSNGVTYSVTLRASTSAAFGEPSNAVVATPATIPNAPSIFNVSPSNDALIISVTPPLNNGGSPIVYYQYSLDAGVTYSSYFETNTLRATGLTNGTSYSVTVRAINKVGASALSSAVSGTPSSRDYVLSVINKGLTPIHAEQDRYNFGPKLAGDMRILLENQVDYLTFNTIDSEGLVWVISDIDGWWNLPDPQIPDIERGFGDGSFDVAGRNAARVITLTGSVLVTESSRGGIGVASASARQKLLSAFNLVKRGTWFIVDEDDYKRACFVRLSGRPNISTVSNRGRIEFSIGLKAADPIKYEWIEGTLDNVPLGTELLSNGYNLKTIGEFGYVNTVTEMYDRYGNIDSDAELEIIREYDGYGKVDGTFSTYEEYRDYKLTTNQTGVSASTTVINSGTSNVYCYFRIIGPLFGPAEIANTTTGQVMTILGPISGNLQVLLPDEDNAFLVEYLDIDTKIREVHKGDFTNGEQTGSSRGLLDPVLDWIYLTPGQNSISFTDFGTDAVTAAPQLQIYWRSGWLG